MQGIIFYTGIYLICAMATGVLLFIIARRDKKLITAKLDYLWLAMIWPAVWVCIVIALFVVGYYKFRKGW